MCARWRIFSRPVRANVENVERYVLACIALHNYLRSTSNAMYTPAGFIDSECSDGTFLLGSWRNTVEKDGNNGLQNIRRVRGSRPKVDAIDMRSALKEYIMSEAGSLGWQLRWVRKHISSETRGNCMKHIDKTLS